MLLLDKSEICLQLFKFCKGHCYLQHDKVIHHTYTCTLHTFALSFLGCRHTSWRGAMKDYMVLPVNWKIGCYQLRLLTPAESQSHKPVNTQQCGGVRSEDQRCCGRSLIGQLAGQRRLRRRHLMAIATPIGQRRRRRWQQDGRDAADTSTAREERVFDVRCVSAAIKKHPRRSSARHVVVDRFDALTQQTPSYISSQPIYDAPVRSRQRQRHHTRSVDTSWPRQLGRERFLGSTTSASDKFHR